jgi:hypothetical protein
MAKFSAISRVVAHKFANHAIITTIESHCSIARAMVVARVVVKAVARAEARAVVRVVAVVVAVAWCIIFSLTATGIRGNIVCHATLAIGVTVFRHATLAIHSVVICRSTTAMHGKHNNQPKEGRVAKMPATEAKQQATTSRRNERTRGWRNTNISTMTATGTMPLPTMTVPTTLTRTTTFAAVASIERYTMC